MLNQARESSSFEPESSGLAGLSGRSNDRAPTGTEEPQSFDEEVERTFDPDSVRRITEDAYRQVMESLTEAMRQSGSPARETIVQWFSRNQGSGLEDLIKLLVNQLGLERIIPALAGDNTDVVLDSGEIETALHTLAEEKKGS